MYFEYTNNVLEDWMCGQIIRSCEYEGFEGAKVNFYGTQTTKEDIRNNSKVSFTDQDLADLIQNKVNFPFYGTKVFSKVGNFFRVYKYEPGQYFKPHRDGSFIDSNNDESMATVLIYLNTNPNSETIIYPYGYSQKWAAKEFECQRGSALVFDHNLWHEGKEVIEGVKYVLRTDIFYKD